MTVSYNEGIDDFDHTGKLSYQNLVQSLKLPGDEVTFKNKAGDVYMAQIPSGDSSWCFGVARLPPDPPAVETPVNKALKIHITLKEDIHNINLGWNIVKCVLCKNKASSFKVARPEFKASDNSSQRGKVITIYAGADRHLILQDWERILMEITTLFVEHEACPGYCQVSTSAKTEKIINGSHYFSYRYESEGKSIPFPEEDPIATIDLSSVGQPAYQEYVSSSTEAMNILWQ